MAPRNKVARGARSKTAGISAEDARLPQLDAASFADVPPQTVKVATATSGNTRTVALVALAAAGYLLWRRFRGQAASKQASTEPGKRGGNKQPQPAAGERKQGFRFDKLFTPPPNQPKPKPPPQDVEVTTSNIPRNKQHKKRKGAGRKGANSGRHDGPDELPEYESTKFDRSKDAWVKSKTKFENKGGRVVMQKETTTYSKGPQL